MALSLERIWDEKISTTELLEALLRVIKMAREQGEGELEKNAKEKLNLVLTSIGK